MLQLANFRPYVTAGAAVVGASLIAVTPTVANDVESDFQQRAATIEHRAVELIASEYIANPLQTWIDIPITAIQNLQPNIDLWGQAPFIIGQQVAANWVQFASQYVGDFQEAAQGAVNFYTGAGAKDFVPLMNTAWGEIMAGNISQAFSGPLYQALFGGTLIPIFDPLESIPGIAATAVTDLGKGLTYATSAGLINFGLAYIEVLPFAFFQSLGNGLQATYNSLSAGDLLGAVLNAINIPGEVVYGQVDPLTSQSINITLSTILPNIAKAMAAPHAQNIGNGGSLPVAIESFLNQLVTGWPSWQTIVSNLQTLWGIYGPAGAASAAAVSGAAGLASPAAFSTAANLAAIAPSVGSVSADVARAISAAGVGGLAGLPADIAGLMGGVGANLASTIPGMILSLLRL